MVFNKDIALRFVSETATFRYYGDWFFCLQMGLTADICYCGLPLSTYRFHPTSFLNGETSVFTSKGEYFAILNFLIRHPDVTEKQKLIGHFAYYYLAFGFLHTGLNDLISILSSYFKRNKNLAMKITLRIVALKLLPSLYNKKYEFIAKHVSP